MVMIGHETDFLTCACSLYVLSMCVVLSMHAHLRARFISFSSLQPKFVIWIFIQMFSINE
ncbi:hypothetical protein BLA29_001876 [Euroglyphus maynei]|uniref:Uncharacterized protein n=1 Tax=Euroglyphus maynei TaxID=6958 RepID=A0A1Y3B0A1_EURMA|nr:hypothetical protein BLA29_001876 [Euroglyphus maynei]